MESKKILPIQIVKKNYCFHCEDNSLELYDINRRPVNYSYILENCDFQHVRIAASHFLCSKCNRRYEIQWLGEPRIPVPLLRGEQKSSFLKGFGTWLK